MSTRVKEFLQEYRETGVLRRDEKLLDESIENYEKLIESLYNIPGLEFVITPAHMELSRLKDIKKNRERK